ncbi:FtsX-like permease family protein [Microbacterium album]|uniref:Permease n=1 Tax=Microbacterium album TaxID=2053191 RepID=A0A917IG64_9MICO|nr:FtsX-like permease family protein [Microbacterium album]GGH40586.1 permease [Microbacterium album]
MTAAARIAPPPALPAASGRAPVARLTWMLARPGAQTTAPLILPALAFAVTTALLLTVLGGVLMFWSWEPDAQGFTGLYQSLSLLALAILAVPLISLGGAAARLSARRRDDRLSTLRLLGATPSTVAGMTVLESTAVAVVGAISGAALYALLMPVVGLVPFAGSPIGATALWVGLPAVGGTIAGIALVAALSAAVGLRQVVVSPLGVRTRQTAPRLHWLRPVIAVAAIGAGFLALNLLNALPGLAIVVAVIVGTFAAGIAVLNLVGPWLIGAFARAQAKRARTAPRLVAARTVLESPKAAWRQVGGVAMTSFVAVVGGTGMALAAGEADPATAIMMADIRTGILLTLLVSFVMVACSVGVNQAASILDRRALYVGLDRIGMPREAMEAARTRATMTPLLFTVVVSALTAGVLVFPLVGIALIMAPVSVLVIALCLLGGVGLVWLALRATRPVLTRVLAQPDRAE